MSGPAFAKRNAPAPNARTTGLKAAPRNVQVGNVRDHLEREADRMADWVTSGSSARRDWSLTQVSAETASGPTVTDGVAPALVHDVLASSGKPLHESVRAKFEPGMDHDLTQVRIHADDKAAESADAVNALAYVVGDDVVFGRGQFQPGSPSGDRLLAHELAHTAQQERGPQDRLQRKYKKEETPPPVNTEGLPAGDVDVRDWPNKLPYARRKGPQQQIAKVPHKLKLAKTTLGGSELNEEQKLIIRQIKINRATDIKEPWPWLAVAGAYNRRIKGPDNKDIPDPDRQGGYQYGGEGAPKASTQPGFKDPKRQELNKEFQREGASISAINTYDNVWLTLGRGLTGVFLSHAMEEFFQNDPKARDMFLDLGALFTDGRLLVVNTDNGAIEEDQLVGNLPAMNARKLFALSEPLLTLYKHVAESEVHAKFLQPAMQKQEQAAGLAIPQSIINTWDTGAIKLAGHLIYGAGLKWSSFEPCNGNVKEIMKVYAKQAVGVNPDKGNARVVGTDYAKVILGFAGGKAREAFDSVITLPDPVPANSQRGKLLLQQSATRYLQMSL